MVIETETSSFPKEITKLANMNANFVLFLIALTLTACFSNPEPGTINHIKSVTAGITDEALISASGSSGDWVTYGLNYSEDRLAN